MPWIGGRLQSVCCYGYAWWHLTPSVRSASTMIPHPRTIRWIVTHSWPSRSWPSSWHALFSFTCWWITTSSLGATMANFGGIRSTGTSPSTSSSLGHCSCSLAATNCTNLMVARCSYRSHWWTSTSSICNICGRLVRRVSRTNKLRTISRCRPNRIKFMRN